MRGQNKVIHVVINEELSDIYLRVDLGFYLSKEGWKPREDTTTHETDPKAQ